MDSDVDGDRPALTTGSIFTSRQPMRVPWRTLAVVPVAFLGIFFVYPLVVVLAQSLTDPAGGLDLSGFAEIVTSAYYRETLWFTTWQAVLSTVLTVAAALPAAVVFVRFKFPGKSLLMALATLPFVLPTVVVAAAFDALLGDSGLLNSGLMAVFGLESAPVQLERTLTLVLIAHVFYNFAVVLRMIVSYWSNQSPQIEEAARSLGAGRWQLWTRVRLPMLAPAISAASVLVFIFTFTSFGVVLILGGPRYSTLEVEIYRQALSIFDLPVAAALSLVQIGLMFAMLLMYSRLQRRITVPLRGEAYVSRVPHSWRAKLGALAVIVTMIVLLLAPLAALIVRSLTTAGGLDNFTRLAQNPRGSILFVPPLTAVGNSLVFASVATVLAVGLGLITAALVNARRWRWLDALFMLPLATSAVTLGFGYLIAMGNPPLNLRSSAVLIPLAHTLVALPFVVRAVLPALQLIPNNVTDAARALGEGPAGVWRRVRLPIIGRALVVGASFSFTVSLGEFGASLFIARPDTPTIPVVIFRLLGQPGAANYGQALAMSVILLVVCGAAFAIIERLRISVAGVF